MIQVTNNNNVENSEYAATVTGANSNLIKSYIKSGVRIGGITGTLEVLDTSDANATAEDILQEQTEELNISSFIQEADKYTQNIQVSQKFLYAL